MYRTEIASSELPEFNRTYTLSDDISAIQLMPSDGAGAGFSPVSRLPRGAQIQACGADRESPERLKVAYEGHFYLVFLDDLRAQRKAMAAAAY